MIESPFLRRFLWFVNKFFMVPLFRLGLGAWVGNPLTGYIMVLKSIGRKTGQVRYTPVNYAILNGNVYVSAGFGKIADWFRNLQSNPHVELLLPGGAVAGIAEEVSDLAESTGALRQVLKNSGFVGLAMGLNPSAMPDDLMREKLKGCPVVRIRPMGIGSGAGDAGGWLWLLGLMVITALVVGLVLN